MKVFLCLFPYYTRDLICIVTVYCLTSYLALRLEFRLKQKFIMFLFIYLFVLFFKIENKSKQLIIHTKHKLINILLFINQIKWILW